MGLLYLKKVGGGREKSNKSGGQRGETVQLHGLQPVRNDLEKVIQTVGEKLSLE